MGQKPGETADLALGAAGTMTRRSHGFRPGTVCRVSKSFAVVAAHDPRLARSVWPACLAGSFRCRDTGINVADLRRCCSSHHFGNVRLRGYGSEKAASFRRLGTNERRQAGAHLCTWGAGPCPAATIKPSGSTTRQERGSRPDSCSTREAVFWDSYGAPRVDDGAPRDGFETRRRVDRLNYT